MNPVLQVMRSHRSVRDYQSEPVDPAVVREAIAAAQMAATSSHIQAYCVIRITDRARRDRLVELTGGSQSNISKHLATLRLHDLVGRRREGGVVYYSVTDPSIFNLCSEVCGGIERTLAERSKAFQE